MNTVSLPMLVDNGSFAWCETKYQHIWDSIAMLAGADERLGIVIQCGDIKPAVVMKKAHTYARRFGLCLMCKTRVGKDGFQVFAKRRTVMFTRKPRLKSHGVERGIAINARLTIGYSSNCSELDHKSCGGLRNYNGKRIACMCPCHPRNTQ